MNLFCELVDSNVTWGTYNNLAEKRRIQKYEIRLRTPGTTLVLWLLSLAVSIIWASLKRYDIRKRHLKLSRSYKVFILSCQSSVIRNFIIFLDKFRLLSDEKLSRHSLHLKVQFTFWLKMNRRTRYRKKKLITGNCKELFDFYMFPNF